MQRAATDTAPKRLMISPAEAAELLSVDRDTVFRLIDERRLIASRLSPRIIRVRLSSVEAFKADAAAWLAGTPAANPGAVAQRGDAWLAKRPKRGCPTSVYVIRAVATTVYKIGIARNPQRRLEGLQTASPALLALVLTIPGDIWTESDLHFRFREDRIRGEWFRESPELLAWMARERLAGGASDV